MHKMAPGAESYFLLLMIIFVIGLGVGFCIGRFA
jgi:hypothetical protein